MIRQKTTGIACAGCVLLPCVAITLGTGCAARVDAESEPAGAYPAPVEEDAVVYVDTVPPEIEAYPHYYYGGGYAYYVEGRWYRRGPRGWGYYRQEPPQLERQRAHVEQRGPAPAIPRERSNVESAPAARRERPSAPTQAPQAPAVSRPSPGVVEAQPPSPSP